MKQKILFIIIYFWVLQMSAKHKIVYLISPPRSMSVAFLRMMEARQDFAILHEPSQYAYDLEYYPEVTSWFKKDAPKNYNEVKQLIFQRAQNSNVFVKEISFAVERFMAQDNELIKDPRVHFVFLLRNPYDSLISFYKKCSDETSLRHPEFSYWIGYEALYKIFQDIKQRAINKPLFIFADELCTKPKETIEHFCHHVGIEFKECSLAWPSLNENFSAENWNEIKHKEATYHWHNEAIQSTSFRSIPRYKSSDQAMPDFSQITNENHRNICLKAYDENNYYYQLLLKPLNEPHSLA